eukprot:4762878-Prymnesium_polylepis.1
MLSEPLAYDSNGCCQAAVRLLSVRLLSGLSGWYYPRPLSDGAVLSVRLSGVAVAMVGHGCKPLHTL